MSKLGAIGRKHHSAIAAWLGLLLSVLAIGFTYAQYAFMKEERLTPYRTQLYAEKLASFKAISSTGLRIIEDGLPYVATPDDRRTPASIARFKELMRDYRNVLIESTVVWPEPIAVQAQDVLHATMLLESRLQGFDEIVTRSGTAIIVATVKPETPPDTLQAAADLVSSIQGLELKMRGDLRAERFQKIAD